MPIIKTICSGCDRPVVLNLANAEAHVSFAGNGLRGAKHVPGGIAIADISRDNDELLVWDCPVCEYADSYDVEEGGSDAPLR